MIRNKIVFIFLLMIVNHVAHVFEEVWAGFWLVNYFGLGTFLMINWVLFSIPVILFYFVINKRVWAYKLSMIYAGIMALQGMGHNAITIFTGKYFDGFAGGFTGIGLFIIGLTMIYYLSKEIRVIE